METNASIHRHPIHPMLVVFPIAFWIGSLICDGIYHMGSHNLFWKDVAFYMMAGGVIGALAAAIPGFVDYLGLRDRPTKRIATIHMLMNLTIVALFVFNLGIRLNATPEDGMLDVFLSILGVCMLAVSGWLGGQLVYVGGVGVAGTHTEQQTPRRAA
jgi:uncharacterized membrane protein